MKFDAKEFGERLRAIREYRGIVRDKAAEDCGLSIEHLKKIERGNRVCSLDVLVVLADYYNVSTDQLLRGDDTPQHNLRKRLAKVIEELEAMLIE